MKTANQDVAIVMNTDRMSKIKQWLLLRKPLPKAPTDEFLDPKDYIYVSDSDVVVGEKYFTKLKEVVTVLDKNIGFMGYICLAQYSNGAIRWISYNNFLYEITD